MKVCVETTGEKMLGAGGVTVRVWHGHSEAGVPVILYTVAVVVPDPGKHDLTEFADLDVIGRHTQSPPDPPAQTLS